MLLTGLLMLSVMILVAIATGFTVLWGFIALLALVMTGFVFADKPDPPGTVRWIEKNGVRMEFEEPMNFWAALALLQDKIRRS